MTSALPAGWQRACLEGALSGADLRYTIHDSATRSEAAVATLRFGANATDDVRLVASVGAGSLRIAIDPLVAKAPTLEQYRLANEVSIDWTCGRIGFSPDDGAFTAISSIFAYPDHVPPSHLVAELCHGLWASAPALAALTTPFAAPPSTFAGFGASRTSVVAQLGAAGLAMKAQPDGALTQRIDMGDDGTVGLRVSFEGEVLRVDALPLACPPWPETLDSARSIATLNHRLRSGVITRWGDQLVIRQSWPLSWIPPHPQWVSTVIDAASWAALDLCRVARGGPLARA